MGRARARGYWTAIETRLREERRAELHLSRQGFQVWLPLVLHERVERGAVRRGRYPMFPRYLFVKIVDRWVSITGTRGVSRVVMMGDQPARLRDDEVEYLRSLQGRDGLVALPPAHAIGDSVVVGGSGDFQGFRGIVASHEAASRVGVLVQMLGHSVSVVFDEADLAPAA